VIDKLRQFKDKRAKNNKNEQVFKQQYLLKKRIEKSNERKESNLLNLKKQQDS